MTYLVTDTVAGVTYPAGSLREVLAALDYFLPDEILQADDPVAYEEKDALVYALSLWNTADGPLESKRLGVYIGYIDVA